MIQQCKSCYWEYDTNDNNCSGCGKNINSYSLFPNLEKIYSYNEYNELSFQIQNNSDSLLKITGLTSDDDVFVNRTNFLEIKPKDNQNYNLNLRNIEINQNCNFRLENNFDSILEFNFLHLQVPELSTYINGVLVTDVKDTDLGNKLEIDSFCFVEKDINKFKVLIKSSSAIIIEDFKFNGNIYNLNHSYDMKDHYLDIETQDKEITFDYKIVNLKKINNRIKFREVSLSGLKLNKIVPNPIHVNKLYENEVLDIHLEVEYVVGGAEIEIKEFVRYHDFKHFLSLKNQEEVQKPFNQNKLIQFDIIHKNYPENKINKDEIIYIPITIKYLNKTLEKESELEIDISVLYKDFDVLDSKLVIDFGTTNSCVSWLNEDNEIKKLYFKENRSSKPLNNSQPTLLYAYDNKEKVFESYEIRAKSVFQLNSYSGTAIGWKKFWGQDIKINLVDEKNKVSSLYSVEELTKIYLKNLISLFEKNEKLKAKRFAFTYPANYESKKYILLNAMKSLGYDEKDISLELNESNSVSYYLAQSDDPKYDFLKNINDGQKINYVIFDMGGGTTDISICSLQKIPKETKNGFDFSIDSYNLDILDSSNPIMSGGDYLDFIISKYIKDFIEKSTDKKIPFPKELDEMFSKKFSDPRLSNLNDQEFDLLKLNFSTLMGISRDDIKIKYDSLLINNQNVESFKLYKYTAKSTIENDSIEHVDIKIQNPKNINDESKISIKNLENECIKPFLKNQISHLDSLIENVRLLSKLKPNEKIDYIILCGNGSKLSLVYDVFNDNYGKDGTQIIIESENGKIATVDGACRYYNTNSNINLNNIDYMYVTLGYEQGGQFLPFTRDSDSMPTTRALNLSEINTYNSAFRKFNVNEKIYYSYKPIMEISKKPIMNNPDIKEAFSVKQLLSELPDLNQYIGEKYRIGLQLDKNFPDINLILDFGGDKKTNPIKCKLSIN